VRFAAIYTTALLAGSFGALLATDLEDPVVRHRLWLALQAHRLLSDDPGGRTLRPVSEDTRR